MTVRREWYVRLPLAKQDYFRALHCLKNMPGQTDQNEYTGIPGARSRWDDFTVAHLLNVNDVHRSPWLAVWHRHYIWQLEKALQDECGYQYGLPYWHWSKYLDQDVNTWPLFDNSPNSISGNGTQTGPFCACVYEGPFANWTVTLGPFKGAWGCRANPRDDGRGYNPRCIERTFQPYLLSNNQYTDVVYVIENSYDADTFGRLIELEQPSVHNFPHLFMGGTQIDVTYSSQDPWFFYHHCMLEFVFSIWQSLDWNTRTTTLPNADSFTAIRRRDGWQLPVPAPTLDSTLWLQDVFPNTTIWDAMWPMRGQYCYRYE
ncbi:hypothetical protein CERZMDRAFT_61170 [Cercospora zeae-maydis SCOH1-5]|uniref:Tyrosinase copper-binding domain-containing protein n=1 Tax=Cercospora zeae-maydis SCOH1-5 TaxID=717836 RepID=A0A6A6F7N9_9PEZI|nr:hypothetical protein CERZMDRAFT_61170 [Cercospora zeae-maydis SCOH1-5]